MANRKNQKRTQSECGRCGTCCQQGGPALHHEDCRLIDEGVLAFGRLVTIRLNEPAHNPIQDRILPSPSEFIKIRGSGNSWSCIYFSETANGCLIYKSRPLECKLLFCRTTGPLEKIMGRELLSRSQLLADDDRILPLIEKHDLECPYSLFNDILASAGTLGQEKKRQLTELVRNDLAVREYFLRHFPERQQEELFLFGRPLFMLLSQYGFRLVEGDAGVTLAQI